MAQVHVSGHLFMTSPIQLVLQTGTCSLLRSHFLFGKIRVLSGSNIIFRTSIYPCLILCISSSKYCEILWMCVMCAIFFEIHLSFNAATRVSPISARLRRGSRLQNVCRVRQRRSVSNLSLSGPCRRAEFHHEEWLGYLVINYIP